MRMIKPVIRCGMTLAAMVIVASGPAWGQTTLYNSNGFESPTYTTGSINGQQGFQGPFGIGLPGANIQTSTVHAGSQALQISGPALVDTTGLGFAGGSFWYQPTPFATAFNPVAQGVPYVHVDFQSRMSGATVLPTDIPFVGVYLEGYNSVGTQQALTPIMVNLNGGISVFTNATAGGGGTVVSTANGVIPRENWDQVYTVLDFQTQTFQVYLNGSETPLQFVTNDLGGSVNLTSVPFRNSSGSPTTRIAEIGIVAFRAADTSPLNNAFIDDYTVIAMNTATPVPEPGTILAVAAVGAFGLRTWRRRRRAA